MEYTRSKADPCLYFRWGAQGLVIWLSWVDDCLICGQREDVKEAKQEMMKRFECDEVSELKEYVGCKLDWSKEEGWIKLTQPVLMQSYIDEFELPEGETPRTLAMPGSVLQKGNEEDHVSNEQQSTYRSGVEKLLHMMKWTRLEILNAVRESCPDS
jgi:Reverse transcriptase (RNA-dependent DNA polymerase)